MQVFQFLRFFVFLIISIFFTKTSLSETEIGDWEYVMFLTGALSFSWVTGFMQSFMTLFKRNRIFHSPKSTYTHTEKSPEFFNAFLLLLAFSLFFSLFILVMNRNIPVFSHFGSIPYVRLVALYFLLSQPTALIEYIYLLRNKPKHILYYGFITFGLQVTLTFGAILLGKGIEGAILWGLVIVSAIRFVWLLDLLRKYAAFQFSWAFIKDNLYIGYPIVISCLLSGSSQYLDGLIASIAFDAENFAIFRYGAKELPFVVVMTTALSNTMIPEFATRKNIPALLEEIKVKSLKMMHFLFPLSIVFMLSAKYLYANILFRDVFTRSADIFMIYQLMIMSRILFPQTILIGLKKTKFIMWASGVTLLVNIPLSVLLVQYYDVVGIALATMLVHILEKIILVGYNHFKLGIRMESYIPIRWFLFYCALIVLVFVLIDHRVIVLW